MKPYLLLLLATVFSLNVAAQPDGTEFPNWTHTDIYGVEHTLYDYLDDGKIVVIDIFTTWCTNCIASLPNLHELEATYGPDGNNTAVFFSFERDPATSDEAEWAVTHNVTNPIFTDALATMETWNTSYQPNFFVICPDRTFQLKIGSIANNNPLPDYVEACGSVTAISENQPLSTNLSATVVQDELRFTVSQNLAKYRVYSMSGMLLLEGTANKNNRLNTSELPEGIYLLQVFTDMKMVTKKFVKQ